MMPVRSWACSSGGIQGWDDGAYAARFFGRLTIARGLLHLLAIEPCQDGGDRRVEFIRDGVAFVDGFVKRACQRRVLDYGDTGETGLFADLECVKIAAFGEHGGSEHGIEGELKRYRVVRQVGYHDAGTRDIGLDL